MYVRLHSADAWGRIRDLTRPAKRPTVLAAVAFLGRGATKRLRLRCGDLLITRFDETNVRAGLVDPREVGEYLKKGVRVRAVNNLHAKVFVIGARALVGSTNVSENSEEYLVEAICESNEPGFVRSCRKFVEDLSSDEVTPEYCKMLESIYKPHHWKEGSRLPKAKRTVTTSGMAVVHLTIKDWDEADYAAERKGAPKAKKLISDHSRFSTDDFGWSGLPPAYLKPGVRLIRITEHSKLCLTASPKSPCISDQSHIYQSYASPISK